MGNRGLARTAVVELSAELSEELAPKPREALGRAYAAALLKVAVELRGLEPRSLEDTLDRILEGTPIDREKFRGYLRRNFSLLRGR